ncbi:MAG: O-antigen ligase family protein [Clostridia bacterium]|nr:O-antigen ligase family protein [Clostridia bacterium]
MDIQSFSKNRQVRALTKFNETYALIMVIIFSVIPLMAMFSPQDFGPIFTGIGKLMIYSLIFLGLFQLISYATFNSKYSVSDRLNFCMKRGLTSILEHKVGIILIVFFVLTLISALVAYTNGKDVIANLEYANNISHDEAVRMFKDMSFTDTRLYKGTDFRPDGVYMYICYGAVFIYASMLKNPKYKKIIFGVNIIGFAAISLIVLQQYYGIIGSAGVKEPGSFGRALMEFYDKKGVRIGHFYKGFTGSFYNLNHAAYYLLVGSMLISGKVIMSKKTVSKILWSLFALYSYYILIINDTFGCYLALIATLVIIGVLKLIYDFKILEKGTYKVWRIILDSLLPLLLVVVMSVSFIAFSGEENSIIKNFKNLGKDVKKVATSDNLEEEHAGSGRLEMWLATVDMIKEKPIFGYGPDNLKSAYVEREAKLDRAHNEPLEKAVASGIPSALVYYAAVILAIVLFLKNKRNFGSETSLLPFMALVGYLISSLFGVFLFYTAGYFVMMLAFISSDKKEPELLDAKSTKNLK